MNSSNGIDARTLVLGAISRRAGVAGLLTVGLLAVGVVAADDARGQTRTVRGEAAYGNDEPAGTDYHEVEKGDTLWDISGDYLGDPHRWPKLWSYNPHITNPHWIYPGDIIYLEPTEEPAEQPDEKRKPKPKVEEQPEVERGLRLGVGGFIVGDEPEFVGRIVDSPKESRLLGEFDTCWVGFGENGYTDRGRNNRRKKNIKEFEDPGKIERQDRFAIVEPKGKITNEQGDELGYKYIVLGSLVVTKKNDDKLDTAYIDQSWREIERGAYLIPYERQLRMVKKTPADKDLVAKIIGSLLGVFELGEYHYVFINKGADDGVRIGNRMYAYEHRTGLPKRWNGETPDEIPWQRIGRLRIVDVTKNFSTGLITDSKREISIGDRLEMYKGN